MNNGGCEDELANNNNKKIRPMLSMQLQQYIIMHNTDSSMDGARRQMMSRREKNVDENQLVLEQQFMVQIVLSSLQQNMDCDEGSLSNNKNNGVKK